MGSPPASSPIPPKPIRSCSSSRIPAPLRLRRAARDPGSAFRRSCTTMAKAGRLAVEHLLERGHRRIAHIHGDMRYASAQGRLASYEATLLAAGIDIDPDLIVGSPWGTRTANIVTQQLLDLAEPPTAIFAASDDLAIGAVQAIEHRGLSVPARSGVIGFDDIPLSDEMMPRLSTVRLPLDAMGRKTAEFLTVRRIGAAARDIVAGRADLAETA